MEVIKIHSNKYIISGNTLEVYEYQFPFDRLHKDVKKDGIERIQISQKSSKERKEKNLNNVRQYLRRLINSNVGKWGNERLKFMTITFSDNCTDLEIANKEFTNFIRRLNYQVFGTKKSILKYIAVPEIQHERFKKYGQAVWHYHILFFNLPYVEKKKFDEIWRNGFTWINAIEQKDNLKNCTNIGAYVCKYMQKDFIETHKGKKCYFASRGLIKPLEDKTTIKIEEIKKYLPKPYSEGSYKSEWNGNITYINYNLNDEQIQCIKDILEYRKLLHRRINNNNRPCLGDKNAINVNGMIFKFKGQTNIFEEKNKNVTWCRYKKMDNFIQLEVK